MRLVPLAVLVVLLAALVAGCGGSGDQTASLNGETVTVPADVHGFYGELEALLAQFPYQGWYGNWRGQRGEEGAQPGGSRSLREPPRSDS